MAEKAAWEFIEKLPEGEKIQLTAINPYVILGPALCKGDFTSAKIVIEVMKGNVPPPKIKIGFVDVRNVATAHVRALERDEAIGQRFILCSDTVWFKEFNQILKDEYGKDYRISTTQPPKFLMTVASWFNSDAKDMKETWGEDYAMDNTRSKEVLGIEYYSVKELAFAMVESLI